MQDRFAWKTSGKALAENIIKGEKYRFTVLTDSLIRAEFNECGEFVDEASQLAFHRDFPAVEFSTEEADGYFYLTTSHLTLTYRKNEEFTKDSLVISLTVKPFTEYHYGDKVHNLKGTYRTLDHANGRILLEDGVCSRDGITLIDDSRSALLTENWFQIRPSKGQDLYFFCYGHDYIQAVNDLLTLTGRPKLLPAFSLGNWWSRYHAYTQEEYEDLILRFESEELPFSVAVVDMDWHIVKDTPESAWWDNGISKLGWTGYTWNEKLFPDYKGFLKFLKDHKLRTSLNLHPASGICYHEAMYEELAKACGIDPDSKKPVKLDLLNPEFMGKYFDMVLHPYEEAGVDFWWMDWQQGKDYWWIHDEDHEKSELEVLDPLWVLNHLHILDISRSGHRPMFFSRYSGLGSQRYPIGFSGDTVITWESLDFQPEFTNTATNAGYIWWSHDIGGHMSGYSDGELATRWVQYGVFSPINRLHSTNDEFTSKEPWHFAESEEEVQGDFLRLRHSLFPYLYTMNKRVVTDGRALCEPMYYRYPECYEAYEVPNQYFFGSEMMVAPLTKKSDPDSHLSEVSVWFPEGKWYDLFTGLVYEGNRKEQIHRYLSEYPVFGREGAIIPLQEIGRNNELGNQENMIIHLCPGKDGEFSLFEDCGDGDTLTDNDFSETKISVTWGEKPIITLHKAEGQTRFLPRKRNWTFVIHGIDKDTDVKPFRFEGEKTYEEETNSLFVTFHKIPITSDLSFSLEATGSYLANSEKLIHDRVKKILRLSEIENRKKRMFEEKLRNYDKYDQVSQNEMGVIRALAEMRHLLGYFSTYYKFEDGYEYGSETPFRNMKNYSDK